MSAPTLLLDGAEVRALLPVEDCIGAVESAFRRQGEGVPSVAGVLGLDVGKGGFHVKAATLRSDRHYLAAKLNGNFPGNPGSNGLPTIQGMVALCDADNGRLLAIMDSIEITRLRTGAATAVAARYLARRDSAVLTVFGSGRQGRAQVACLARVLPLERVYAYDVNAAAAATLVRWVEAALGLEAEAVDSTAVMGHARQSDIIVTCTPSREYFLPRASVRAGSFVAAVGADAPGKQELEPELLAENTLVVDVLEQCAAIGDLHHALVAGIMRREDVHAELAEVVAGRRPGRTDPSEITIFDSTGTGLEDAAAAALVYQRALAGGRGIPVDLAGTPDTEGAACNG